MHWVSFHNARENLKMVSRRWIVVDASPVRTPTALPQRATCPAGYAIIAMITNARCHSPLVLFSESPVPSSNLRISAVATKKSTALVFLMRLRRPNTLQRQTVPYRYSSVNGSLAAYHKQHSNRSGTEARIIPLYTSQLLICKVSGKILAPTINWKWEVIHDHPYGVITLFGY